ncbi:MAG: tungsten formylmethanofuran dehydrogenase [Chloroflexaceae bacterium]|nr:tungsten formylmethanofuran dehydrogenase [Chloroflexaceae bacterium]NJL33859.1 tungsten formylmethanofuran dehydrogenase [Chloroflexaceae bacterium]
MQNNLGLDIDGTLLGQTRLSDIDGATGRLRYCGYDFHDLATSASWEEVVYLLLHDDLPTPDQLGNLTAQMTRARTLSAEELNILRHIPAYGHGMDTVRTALSTLAQYHRPALMQPETILEEGLHLTARLPTIVAALIRLHNGQEPVAPDPNLSHAANFLWMLHNAAPDPVTVQALDTYLVVLAENGLNISTFVAAVVASTRNDLYAAITAAISTLKGLSHGGANEHAMRTFLEMGSPDRVAEVLSTMLARKDRLMGVGHRIFEVEDPRVRHLRTQSAALANHSQVERSRKVAHAIATRTAELIEIHPFFRQRKLYPNVEFYSAPLLYQLGFPVEYFTVAFACARMPGWVAHIAEQLGQRRLVRPEAQYVGRPPRDYVPLARRTQ